MKDLRKEFTSAFKKSWYVQGFNANPLFLSRAGISGFRMKKELGFGYSVMLYHFKNGYCEFHYFNDDFKRIWDIVKGNLKKDPRYVEKIAQKYQKIFSKHKGLFKKIENLNLKKVSEKELIELLHKTSDAMIDACGIAHSVDPIGIGLEDDFREELSKEISKDDSNFNHYYSILTTPTKLSFLGKEERDLRKITLLDGQEKKEALEKHLQKYFWVNNSYAGPALVNIKTLKSRLKLINRHKTKAKFNKESLIKQLSLSKHLQKMIHLIDYATLWQDTRKKNLLISVAYLSKIAEEIGRRVNIPTKFLYQLAVKDLEQIKTLDDVRNKEKELIQRSFGNYMIHREEEELIVYGQEYHELFKKQQVSNEVSSEEPDLHGSIANRGTAVGRVVICKNLESIEKVQKGDILVASMTRPEFMPALKKAIGIVTDEGGITCHAAIISRELGIPCVVGTKIATKVLKDGMEIEVRANHGFVRIIS